MLATDPTQPIAPGWSRVTVQFRSTSAFFDMPSDRLDARLEDFEQSFAKGGLRLDRVRYTDAGAVGVDLIAKESMKQGPESREVICTAGLWGYVYQAPVTMPHLPNLTRENLKTLDWHIKKDGGFLLTCIVGQDKRWSYRVARVDLLAKHGASAMPAQGLPHGTVLN
jgi:hypothetical protein